MENPTNLEQIINLQGKERLDVNINYGLLLFITFISEHNGMSIPEYISDIFKKSYEEFKQKHKSLYYDGESFYIEK